MGSNSNRAKVATVSDLLHRVAASCLSQRLPSTRNFDSDSDLWSCNSSTEADKDKKREESIARAIAREKLEDEEEEEEEEEDEEQRLLRMWEEDKDVHAQPLRNDNHNNGVKRHSNVDVDFNSDLHFKDQVKYMDALLAQVFDSVTAVKHAYRSLQHSHCPWDPNRMQTADAAVVSELRKLDTLRDRFRRGRRRPFTVQAAETAPLNLKEAVAPYEAVLDELKKEVKVKEAEADNLRQKLRNSEMISAASRKGRSHSSRWSKGVGLGAGIVGNLFWTFFYH